MFLKYFGVFKSINKGPPGVKNPEIMKMLAFGPSHNETKFLLDQIDPNNPPEFLNLLFKHTFN